ncbi:hypothetical protein PAHAL_5G168200 [Panicum hallii]|uniref:Uncharacterized protein n=1 Tax=Panicum hallii TaxID=206008 RepID=A0A2T8IK74_9POAL|nr:hypothetical protein PAHAL_5G168200 [Panicum hallii]
MRWRYPEVSMRLRFICLYQQELYAHSFICLYQQELFSIFQVRANQLESFEQHVNRKKT